MSRRLALEFLESRLALSANGLTNVGIAKEIFAELNLGKDQDTATVRRLDVNSDGRISPLDALNVINPRSFPPVIAAARSELTEAEGFFPSTELQNEEWSESGTDFSYERSILVEQSLSNGSVSGSASVAIDAALSDEGVLTVNADQNINHVWNHPGGQIGFFSRVSNFFDTSVYVLGNRGTPFEWTTEIHDLETGTVTTRSGTGESSFEVDYLGQTYSLVGINGCCVLYTLRQFHLSHHTHLGSHPSVVEVNSRSTSSTVTVRNLSQLSEPVASINNSEVVYVGDAATLDGSGSYDPDNVGDDGIVSWQWFDVTNGKPESLGSGEIVLATWESSGVKTLELRVTDDEGVQAFTTTQLLVDMDLELLSVADSDSVDPSVSPDRPKITFEAKGQFSDVSWQIGDEPPSSLGPLGTGTHTFYVSGLAGYGASLHQLELKGATSAGESAISTSSVDLSFLKTQSGSRAFFVYVFSEGTGLRSARVTGFADIYKVDWSLPGAIFDRRVGRVATNIISSVDIPTSGWSYVVLDEFYDDRKIGLTEEEPQIGGNTGGWGSAFEESISSYGKSGESSIAFGFGASSQPNAAGGITPWWILSLTGTVVVTID